MSRVVSPHGSSLRAPEAEALDQWGKGRQRAEAQGRDKRQLNRDVSTMEVHMIYTCISTYIYIYIYNDLCICMCVYIYIYIYMYICI